MWVQFRSRMEFSFIHMQPSIIQKTGGKTTVLWDHCVVSLGSQTEENALSHCQFGLKWKIWYSRQLYPKRYEWFSTWGSGTTARVQSTMKWAGQQWNTGIDKIEKLRKVTAWGQPHFSSCLLSVGRTTVCCEACLLLLLWGTSCGRTGQEQNKLSSLAHCTNWCECWISVDDTNTALVSVVTCFPSYSCSVSNIMAVLTLQRFSMRQCQRGRAVGKNSGKAAACEWEIFPVSFWCWLLSGVGGRICRPTL